MAKSKKYIRTKKTKAFKAKNLAQLRTFFTSNIRKDFTKLRQAFIEAPILNFFDPEHPIQIKTDVLGHVTSRILSQLTLDDLGPMTSGSFFF